MLPTGKRVIERVREGVLSAAERIQRHELSAETGDTATWRDAFTPNAKALNYLIIEPIDRARDEEKIRP